MEYILFIPLLGRFIGFIYEESNLPEWKRFLLLLENTLLYYFIGGMGYTSRQYFSRAIYFPILLILLFVIVGTIEYFLIKRRPSKFWGDENIKPINVFWTFYHEFFFALTGYVVCFIK